MSLITLTNKTTVTIIGVPLKVASVDKDRLVLAVSTPNNECKIELSLEEATDLLGEVVKHMKWLNGGAG